MNKIKSITLAGFMNEFHKPKLSEKNRQKLGKLRKLKSSLGDIASGTILEIAKERFMPLDEIRSKYHNYIEKFRSKYYLFPIFSHNCHDELSHAYTIEDEMDRLIRCGYIEKKETTKGILYRTTYRGEVVLPALIMDKELAGLLNNHPR